MSTIIRRFLAYYQPYKKLFVLDFSCAVIAASLEISFPIFVNYVVDKLLPSMNLSLIVIACAGLLGVYCLTAFMQFVVTYWGHMLGTNIETDMRQLMFNHLQKLSFRFFDNHKTGHLMSRISNDLMAIGEVAHHGPEDVFIAAITLIATFGVMLFVHTQLAILTFVVIPFLIWLGLLFNWKMTGAFEHMHNTIADFNARVEDNIGGMRVVQAFTNEEHEKSLFAINNVRFRAAKLAAYKIMAWSASLSYMLKQIMS